MSPRAEGMVRQLGRAAFWLLVSAPLTVELASGSWMRLGRLEIREALLFGLLALGSLGFWALLLSAGHGSRRRRAERVALGALVGVGTGVHWTIWKQYSSMLTAGLVEQASRHGGDVLNTLTAGRADLALTVGLPGVLGGFFASLAAAPEHFERVGRKLRGAVLALLLAVMLLGAHATGRPADGAILGSLASFSLRALTGQIKPALACPDLPWLPATEGNRVNVLLVLTESVRQDAYCNHPADPCRVTPVIHRVFGDRVPVTEMRAVASWTIQSFAAITTGRSVLSRGAELRSAPTVFDFARAAGRHTEMLGSQRLEYLMLRTQGIDQVVTFENLGLPSDHQYSDENLMRLAGERLSRMPEPYFVLLQLGDTHSPYTVDPEDAPFVPYARDFSWDGTPLLYRQYQNAVHRQDRILGRALAELRATGRLDRTVVIFTSDHGEAFREHAQIFHGGSLREEEIHVPSWIWVPEGLRKTFGQRYQTLLARAGDFSSHLDLLPTMLDLFGVLDDPALRPYLGAMPGGSLLSSAHQAPAVALSNCSDLMECAFKTYGVLKAGYEIEAREWDGYWNCWDLRHRVLVSMGTASCQDLLVEARRLHPVLPNGRGY